MLEHDDPGLMSARFLLAVKLLDLALGQVNCLQAESLLSPEVALSLGRLRQEVIEEFNRKAPVEALTSIQRFCSASWQTHYELHESSPRCHDCGRQLVAFTHCVIDNKAFCDVCVQKYVGDPE